MKLCSFEVGLDRPLFLIAGPCVIESQQMALDTAGQLQELAQSVRQGHPELEVRSGELAQAEGVLAWSLLAAPAGRG